MNSRMAEEAREEGFTEIAAKFELVAKVEKEHEQALFQIKPENS